MMNVLFVSHKYPPSIGGMQTFSYHLVKGMQSYCNVSKIVKQKEETLYSFFKSVCKKIENEIKLNPKIELVHIVDGTLAMLVSKLIKKYPQIKWCVTIHGLEATYPLSIYRYYFRKKINLYDKVICVSKSTAQLVNTCGIYLGKIEVINNGISIVNNVEYTTSNEIVNKYQRFQDKKIIYLLGVALKGRVSHGLRIMSCPNFLTMPTI
jgi:glycosyltransferase involved in cell wall biosynthesis